MVNRKRAQVVPPPADKLQIMGADKPLPKVRNPRAAWCRIAGFLIAVTGCTVTSALDTRTTFTVGAQVLPRTTLRVKSGPTAVWIAPENVRDGYVEVAEPTFIEVANNNPTGYTLVITPQTALFSSLTVHGAGVDTTFGNDGGSIVERGQTGYSLVLQLTYRFDLTSSVTPGRYPWPIQLSVQPLGAP